MSVVVSASKHPHDNICLSVWTLSHRENDLYIHTGNTGTASSMLADDSHLTSVLWHNETHQDEEQSLVEVSQRTQNMAH